MLEMDRFAIHYGSGQQGQVKITLPWYYTAFEYLISTGNQHDLSNQDLVIEMELIKFDNVG